jgi:hypothetical protein
MLSDSEASPERGKPRRECSTHLPGLGDSSLSLRMTIMIRFLNLNVGLPIYKNSDNCSLMKLTAFFSGNRKYSMAVLILLLLTMIIWLSSCKDRLRYEAPVYLPLSKNSNTITVTYLFSKPNSVPTSSFLLYLDNKLAVPIFFTGGDFPIYSTRTRNTTDRIFKVSLVTPPIGYNPSFPGSVLTSPPDTTKIVAEKSFTLAANGNASVYLLFDGSYDKFRIGGFSNNADQKPAPGKCKLRVFNGMRKIVNDLYTPDPEPAQVTFFDKTAIQGFPGLIKYGQTTDYVEIPANSYQLRVLDENGKLITSPSDLLNPGSTYTLFLKGTGVTDPVTGGQTSINAGFFLQESAAVSGDTAAVRLQIVNADVTHPAGVGASLNGIAAGSLALGQATSALEARTGNNIVSFSEGSNLLAEETKSLSSLQTQIAYLLPPAQEGGKPEILYAPSFLQRKRIDNLQQPDRAEYTLDIFVNFINLSPDAGEVDFRNVTLSSGLELIGGQVGSPFSGQLAYKELLFPYSETLLQQPALFRSFIWVSLGSGNQPPLEGTNAALRGAAPRIAVSKVLSPALGSEAGRVIATLDYPYVSNYEQYIEGGIYKGPLAEPGNYTIALVGLVNSTDPATKARLVVIKHEQ